MSEEISFRRVDVGEVHLHCACAGDRGPLVVFLHGFPEAWFSWEKQLVALARAGFRAVAPDMRGYNESDKPLGVASYEVERLTEDVAALVRAFGETRAHVVGHDWGGVVAWAFAMLYPEMLDRLAVINLPHPERMLHGFRTARQLKKSWYIFFFQLPFAERLLARHGFALLRRIFIDDIGEQAPRYVEAIRREGALSAALAYYRASIRRAATGRVPDLRVIERPVLVLWGENDRYLGKELAVPSPKWVPHARVVFLPGVSHWVQHEVPDVVNAKLLEFFGQASS